MNDTYLAHALPFLKVQPSSEQQSIAGFTQGFVLGFGIIGNFPQRSDFSGVVFLGMVWL